MQSFWAIVRSYAPEKRRRLLEFVTASDRVPVNGVGSVTFCITRNGSDSEVSRSGSFSVERGGGDGRAQAGARQRMCMDGAVC